MFCEVVRHRWCGTYVADNWSIIVSVADIFGVSDFRKLDDLFDHK